MGRSLLESLTAFRTESQIQGKRPIILIGHSLGGLLIKEALLCASRSPRYDLSKTCCGLLFFGVPNYGLRNEQLQSLVQGRPNEALIRDLLVDRDMEPSAFLRRISNQFAESCKGQYPVISFYEMKHSPTVVKQADGSLTKSGDKILMVTEKSATSTGIAAVADEYNIGLDADHSGLVKFSARSQESYLIVTAKIKTLASEGLQRILENTPDSLPAEAQRAWANLNRPPYDSFRVSERLAKPEEGTLQWLIDKEVDEPVDWSSLSSKDFISWRDSSESEALLITGNPGQGKSVLSSFVVSSLEQNKIFNCKIVYYFCNIRIDESQRNAASVLRSLIVQLCEKRQSLFQILPSDFANDSHLFFTASLDTLLHVFANMISASHYDKVYCIIDGLDVYQDGMNDLTTALSRIFGFPTSSQRHPAKLICTSRPIRSVLEAWGQSPQKILRCNSNDLEIFIESRIAGWKAQFTADEEGEITKLILDNAQRTFLWIDVVFRKIRQISFLTLAKVKETINNSSSELYELYRQLLKEMVQTDGQFARILVWIVFSKRPLHYNELAEAVAIAPNVQYTTYTHLLEHRPRFTPDLLHRHLGTLLVVLDDKVYPIHQSVKDFFETERPLREYLGDLEPRLWPAYVSMTYLNLDTGHSNLAKNQSFFEYSSRSWFRHIVSANDIYKDQKLKSLVISILDTTSERVQAWISCIWSKMWLARAGMKSPSQIAIELDIDWLAQVLLDGGVDLLVAEFDKDSFFISTMRYNSSVLRVLLEHKQAKHIKLPQEGVAYIAQYHRPDVVRLMLEHRGSEIKITTNVVQAASVNLHDSAECLALLLERRLDEVMETVDIAEFAARAPGIKPLAFLLANRPDDVVIDEEVISAAVNNWTAGKDILSFLLRNRPNDVVITEEIVAGAARNWAAGKDILAFLLKNRPHDVVVTEKVLKAAARNHSGDIMAFLLEKRSNDVIITEEVGKVATRRDNKELLRILFEQRLYDFILTEEVLKAAAEDCDEEVMDWFLDKWPDEAIITEEVMIAAARNRRYGKVMVVLLDQKPNDPVITEAVVLAVIGNTRSDTSVLPTILKEYPRAVGISALYHASNAGNIEAVQLLLEKDFDLTTVDNDGRTLLHAASSGGNINVVKLLLEQGADSRMADNIGRTPLYDASNDGHIEVVKLLIDRGADWTVGGKSGWTPLHCASYSGHIDVVKLLINHDANWTVGNENGWTPLHCASFSGHIKVVKLLINHGANWTIGDENGFTPLHYASDNGHIEVVKLLLGKGADWAVASRNGWTPLNAALDSGHIKVVELLLEHGADWRVTNNSGSTTLIIAATRGHAEMVKVLLAKEGYDTHKCDLNGLTALAWAAKKGHGDVIDLLIENGAEFGNSHLNMASQEGQLGAVKRFIHHGVDWRAPDSSGLDALQVAILEGHDHIEAYLVSLGGVVPDDVFGVQALFE